MAGILHVEVVAFDDTGKAFADRQAANIDPVNLGEHALIELGADLQLCALPLVETEFVEPLSRPDMNLGEEASLAAVQATGAFLAPSHLTGAVAVAFGSFHRHHPMGRNFNQSNRHGFVRPL